jgi:predicted transcriptional regulator of viral defense system
MRDLSASFGAVLQCQFRGVSHDASVVEDVPVVTLYRALRDCAEIPIGDELLDQALQAAGEQNLITATQRLDIEGVRALIQRTAAELWQREQQS